MFIENTVRFSLWAVLSFMFLAGTVAVTFLYAEGKETRTKQQEVLQRIVKIETQYTFIITGLQRLTTATEKVAENLETHSKDYRRNTKNN